MLILARAPVAAITSEAPVAKMRDQHIIQFAGDVPLTGLERQGLPSKRRRVGLPSPARVFQYDDQGHNKCNRRGVQLCAAFQTGSCSSPCPQQFSARSAYTLNMALRTVQKLAHQFRSRHVMVRTRERERSRKERSARNPSGDSRQVDLLGVRPRLSRTCRMRSVCRPESNSRVNNFDPMTFTLDVVVKSWACSGRNGVILSRFQGHRRARPCCNVSLCMLVHT